MRSLIRLRCDHSPREFEGGTVPFEIFVAPHGADDLDGFGPLRARALAIDVECSLLHGRRSARSPLDASLREDVGSGDLFRHPRRMGEAIRQQRYAESQAKVFRGLCQSSEHYFGRRTMRPPLAKVMLDEPGNIESELIGELHLIEHLVVRALLPRSLPIGMLARIPWPRCIDFVEQIELHPHSLRAMNSGLPRDPNERSGSGTVGSMPRLQPHGEHVEPRSHIRPRSV